MPMRIKSDRLAQHKKEMSSMMDYSMGEPMHIPVDLNGARTDFPKGGANDNLAKAAQDNRERFDMNLPGKGKADILGGTT